MCCGMFSFVYSVSKFGKYSVLLARHIGGSGWGTECAGLALHVLPTCVPIGHQTHTLSALHQTQQYLWYPHSISPPTPLAATVHEPLQHLCSVHSISPANTSGTPSTPAAPRESSLNWATPPQIPCTPKGHRTPPPSPEHCTQAREKHMTLPRGTLKAFQCVRNVAFHFGLGFFGIRIRRDLGTTNAAKPSVMHKLKSFELVHCASAPPNCG